MQIHEITRRPLNELTPSVTPSKVSYGPGFAKPAATTSAAPAAAPASSGAMPATATAAPASSGSTGGIPGKIGSALGGTAAVAGGIVGALGKSLMAKAFGGVDVTDKKTGAVMNRSQALKLGQDMAKTLMPVMMKNWQTQVQAAMAQSIDPATKAPPTSAAKLTPGEQSRLKAQLTAMVNQAIRPQSNFDYTKLADYVGDTVTPEGQTVKADAMQAIQSITRDIEAIFRATLDPRGNSASAWQDLMTTGIAPAQGVLAFDTGTGSGFGVGSRTGAVTLTPQQQALADQVKLTDADVINLRQAARDPAKAAVLAQMLGMTK